MDIYVMARFWSKVNLHGPEHPKLKTCCWIWPVAKGHRYGTFYIDGKNEIAHRVAWFLANGKWPSPNALHRCDNTSCVRPDHLFEGTQRDNVNDMLGKHRQAVGEFNGKSKLTSTQVAEIREMYSEGGVTQASLARLYFVSESRISKIVSRKEWRHAK